MGDEPQTWHYGVVAQWWAEFNVDGPEIDYFRDMIERYGQPALDVACGTGRLLLPFLRAGLDVDGCDISPDMLALCRDRAERAGLAPRLYAQAMHLLDLSRHYRTIFICGAFGLGGNRHLDQQALRLIFEHLEPGGVLVMDNYVPYGNPGHWKYWLRSRRGGLPEPAQPPQPRRLSDGSDLALHARVIDFDPLEQVITYEMHAQRWRDGELDADEMYTLREGLYFRNELLMMLEHAGFADIRVEADYTGQPATRDTDVLVFVATKGA
jgi:SAM-dependent methyltransferase